jgi:hypothetical protein
MGRTARLSAIDKLASRKRELQELWKPVGIVLSIFSFIGSVREFQHRTGPLFLLSFGLLVLAIVILFTVPIKGVRFFVRRLVAFLLDFLLFSLITIGISSVLFELGVIRQSALASMTIVWSWILAFVLLEWWFSGTPGTHMMGLRLRGKAGASVSFLNCVTRNLISVVVPLAVAGSVLSINTMSKRIASAEWAIGVALLSFCPLSIAFSGGQSLPDLLVGIAVLPKRSHEDQFPAALSRRKWCLLVLASLSIGTTYGFLPGLREAGEIVPLQFPVTEVSLSSESEAQMAAGLWAYVESGMDRRGFLQDVRVYSVTGNLPLGAGEDQSPEATACLELYKAKRSFKTVRLQIDPAIPTLVASGFFGNMVNTVKRFVGRPGFLVINISRKHNYGVFTIDMPEDYTFCLAGSDAAPENNFVGGRRSIQVRGSLNEIAWLLLGQLDWCSDVEKYPVYPW